MYCKENGLLNGTSTTTFNPDGTVNAEMACTVALRWLGYGNTENSEWAYNTSVAKAKSVGIAPDTLVGGKVIIRGKMASVFYRAMLKKDGIEVVSDKTPYSIPDYSQEANPEIFNENYTRERYNMWRYIIIERQELLEEQLKNQME
jgi:hypothetical protein